MKFAKPELIKSLIFFITLIVILAFFDFPMSKNINGIYQDLKDRKEALANEYKLGNYFEKSLEDFQELKEEVPPYQDIFTLGGNELKLITKLEKLADDNNLSQILNLSPTKSDFSPNIEKLGLKLDITGSYFNLVNYLTELGRMSFELTVTAVDIKQFEGENLKVSLLTNTYWLK